MCEDTIINHMKVFQNPLPLVEEPFAAYAEKLGISQEETIAILRNYLNKGIIRRVAGVLKHQAAGFTVNAMIAFAVEPADCDSVGKALSEFPFITHCYRRTDYLDWPYTIYAMVHARSEEELGKYIEKIKLSVVCRDIIILRSLKEYKKCAFRME